MRLLIDTHALFWWAKARPQLSARARTALEDADNEVLLSAVVLWEMAGKFRIGKWPEAEAVLADLDRFTDEYALAPLPITLTHARLAGLMPGLHRDPFDRMLAAQSRVEAVPIVSADPRIASLGADLYW